MQFIVLLWWITAVDVYHIDGLLLHIVVGDEWNEQHTWSENEYLLL